nr:retrotransposon Orf1 [Tanacetum cinerariifolium]
MIPQVLQAQILSKKDLGYESYHVVLPPPTGLFSPSKIDLSYSSLEEFQQPEFESHRPKSCKIESKNACENIPNELKESTEVKESFDVPLVKKLVSDDKLEKKTIVLDAAKIEFIKAKQQEKPVRKPVKYAEMYRSQGPSGKQRNWNNLKSQQLGSNFVMYNKACYVCGSFEHLQYDCDKRVMSPVWNNSRRVNHKNFANKFTHPHPKMNFIPQAVLIRSGQVSLNTRQTVNSAKPVSNVINRAHSTVRRPFNQRTAFKNKNLNQKVNTALGNEVYAVKALGCWIWRPKQNVIDHVSKQNSTSMTLKRFDYIDV